jgi:hypothetical protein
MSGDIKVPMTVKLIAGDVVVGEVDDAALFAFVLGVLLNPPDKTLPPLPGKFLPDGYRSYP